MKFLEFIPMLVHFNWERYKSERKTYCFLHQKTYWFPTTFYSNRERTTKHRRNPEGVYKILLGQKLIIYTDNKNITCKIFNTDRVLRWKIILEEYGPDIEYLKGDKNIVAGALSRLPLNGNQYTTHKSTDQKKIVSEINDIKEPPEGTFTN